MKNRLQGVITGFLSAILLIGTVFAATTHRETKLLNYTDLRVCIDGEMFDLVDSVGQTVEPFSVDGVTYLPLRVMAGLFGKAVDWDQATNIVYLGKRPGGVQHMFDVVPAYQYTDGRWSEYYEFSSIANDGKGSFYMAGQRNINGCYWYCSSIDGLAYSIYNLNGNYTSIKGTLGHIDYNDRTGAAIMYIYLDGKLNKEIILTADMIPIEVIIDVANVSQLRIEIANTTTLYDAVYGLANVTIE